MSGWLWVTGYGAAWVLCARWLNWALREHDGHEDDAVIRVMTAFLCLLLGFFWPGVLVFALLYRAVVGKPTTKEQQDALDADRLELARREREVAAREREVADWQPDPGVTRAAERFVQRRLMQRRKGA